MDRISGPVREYRVLTRVKLEVATHVIYAPLLGMEEAVFFTHFLKKNDISTISQLQLQLFLGKSN